MYSWRMLVESIVTTAAATICHSILIFTEVSNVIDRGGNVCQIWMAFSCEYCRQIVVCKNNSHYRPICCNVLAHEMIHMFDFCRADVDFRNLEHLACTEVRHLSIDWLSIDWLSIDWLSIDWFTLSNHSNNNKNTSFQVMDAFFGLWRQCDIRLKIKQMTV